MAHLSNERPNERPNRPLGPEAPQPFAPRTAARRRGDEIWRRVFHASTAVAIIALAALLLNVTNSAFGYAAVRFKHDPSTITFEGRALPDLDRAGRIGLIRAQVPKGVVRDLDADKAIESRPDEDLEGIIEERLTQPKVLHTWSLADSLFHSGVVRAEQQRDYPDARLEFRRWLSWRFITAPQSGKAEIAGIRTAILGSLWMIVITILFAFPVGVGAAIYLEEYADRRSRVNQLIQTNINNLAGVPSIIYGMLGLAILVRAFKPFTSGYIFGVGSGDSGRTILSAALTLGLLVLPLLIINGQEAIRAVPNSLRQASFGIGATRWQTIYHHVLPSALPGILTGTILSISRAIGETAPIIVVGASTLIFKDPTGPFSAFTALPIQIYQWTSRPEDVFRSIAAAAILALLILLLTLNASAVVLRHRYRVKG
ncbi:MAG: phosphate ABC transporter permease PstA [Ardenticatenales bacterium]